MDEDGLAIERIRSGNADAYAVLVRNYQARVRGYCAGTLGNAADADDAAQEIFIKAYQALNRFRGESSFSTWIYRIAVNHCRDLLRRKARRRAESLDALREEQGDWLEAQTAVPPKADRPDERQLQVREALAGMAQEAREALVLREVQGLSYQETAQALNCSLDAVKARLRRARKDLEARLIRRGF